MLCLVMFVIFVVWIWSVLIILGLLEVCSIIIFLLVILIVVLICFVCLKKMFNVGFWMKILGFVFVLIFVSMFIMWLMRIFIILGLELCVIVWILFGSFWMFWFSVLNLLNKIVSFLFLCGFVLCFWSFGILCILCIRFLFLLVEWLCICVVVGFVNVIMIVNKIVFIGFYIYLLGDDSSV